MIRMTAFEWVSGKGEGFSVVYGADARGMDRRLRRKPLVKT